MGTRGLHSGFEEYRTGYCKGNYTCYISYYTGYHKGSTGVLFGVSGFGKILARSTGL